MIKKEFKIDLNKAKYFESFIGWYSALSTAGYLSFPETLKLLRIKGDAMQNAVPKGEGGMLAVLAQPSKNRKILNENQEDFIEIANDNQKVKLFYGKIDLSKLIEFLKSSNIKILNFL